VGEVGEGVGERGRNDPNIVCTYELKKKKRLTATELGVTGMAPQTTHHTDI
jgi:hypothetical protein